MIMSEIEIPFFRVEKLYKNCQVKCVRFYKTEYYEKTDPPYRNARSGRDPALCGAPLPLDGPRVTVRMIL